VGIAAHRVRLRVPSLRVRRPCSDTRRPAHPTGGREPVRCLGAALVVVALMAATAGCSDEPPEITVIPTVGSTGLVPDTGAPDGGSGATTPDEQLDTCSTLRRTYFLAVGADGTADALQPL